MDSQDASDQLVIIQLVFMNIFATLHQFKKEEEPSSSTIIAYIHVYDNLETLESGWQPTLCADVESDHTGLFPEMLMWSAMMVTDSFSTHFWFYLKAI